jgi:phage regulator Rha-like protein
LKPQKILNAMACVQQMSYYAHHAASLLVVYAANKRHHRLMEDIKKIRRELNDNARLVLTEGPAVGIA